jgi:hypothetical protein
MSSHEDLSIVLIQSALVVANGRHVLDDDCVVRVLALLVKYSVSFNHVINNIGLGNLLGTELFLGAQVLAVIVAKVVVAGNGSELDTSTNQEVNKSGLHLSLARLEVITTNESIVPLGKLDATGNKGVLGGSVDEGSLFENAGNSKDSRWSNLLMTVLDGLHEIVGSVIDASDKLSKALSVGSPLDDDLVQSVLGLEITSKLVRKSHMSEQRSVNLPNVLANLLNMLKTSLASLDEVVGTVFLVGSNEVGVVDARKRNHLRHLLLNLGLQGWLEHGSSVHGLRQVHLADVPTADDKIIGVNHGQDVMEWNVDILGSLCICTQLHGGTHDNRAIVISSTRTFAGVPDKTTTVGNDTCSDSGTVVSTPADKHHTSLGDMAFDLEVVDSLLGSCDILAFSGLGD